MKSLGICQAKAHLSQLVREASNGERSIVTDNRKPVAMIGPPPQTSIETGAPQHADEEPSQLPDASAFRRALLTVPYPLDLDF